MADTIKGGAGADIITGGDGNDSLTGGAGKDTFTFGTTQVAQGQDTITDFDFGTNTGSANVDKFDLSLNTDVIAMKAIEADGVIGDVSGSIASIVAGTSAPADTDIFVLNDKAYDTENAIEDTLAAQTGGSNTVQGIFIAENSFGNVVIGTDADVKNDAGDGTETDFLVTLTGVSISDVVSNIDIGDFTY